MDSLIKPYIDRRASSMLEENLEGLEATELGKAIFLKKAGINIFKMT